MYTRVSALTISLPVSGSSCSRPAGSREGLSMRSIAIFLVFASAAWSAEVIPGDARKGAEIFSSQRCVVCHSVNGEGGHSAPDLGKRTGRDYSPAQMAGLMWNHAPTMWEAMEKSGIARPKITSDDAADLFAYFFAARYFERPGDAARGRQYFVSKGCSGCHNISTPGTSGAKPVAEWQALASPIDLARNMWNHAPQMEERFSKENRKWPELTAQELTDILVYLQNLPQTRTLKPEFAAASAETGKQLFSLKGCAGCHQGNKSLERRGGARTMNDFAAAMWNHSRSMRQKAPELRPEEMQRLVGYVWSLQFFQDPGNAARGKRVFEGRCAACHNTPPASAKSSFGLVAGLWDHGPTMLSKMQQRNVVWPRFKGNEMADLLAYLRPKP